MSIKKQEIPDSMKKAALENKTDIKINVGGTCVFDKK
jgi:hypothetical protein